MRIRTVFTALVLFSAVASAQDVSSRVGQQITGPMFNTEGTFALKDDYEHAFAETYYRPNPSPQKGVWNRVRSWDWDYGNSNGSAQDVNQWVSDLATAKRFGVPTIDATGPVTANGRVGMIVQRVEGAAGDPLYAGNKDMSRRYQDYTNPETTLADLSAIEKGTKAARDHGVPIVAGHLQIDASGHVSVPYVEKVSSYTTGGDGLPLPPNPQQLKASLDHQKAVIDGIRAEVKNVQAVSKTLQESGIETDPRKANALAAKMLGEMLDTQKHVTHSDRAPLSPDMEKVAEKLVNELRPSFNATCLDVAARDTLASVIRDRAEVAAHGPVVGGVTAMQGENGSGMLETYRVHKDGTVEFDAADGDHKRGTFNYTPNAAEAARIAANMKKFSTLPPPTPDQQTLRPGDAAFDIEVVDCQSHTYRVNMTYLTAHKDVFGDFSNLSNEIANKVDPVKANGMTHTFDKIK
jgi:hypothetical protein